MKLLRLSVSGVMCIHFFKNFLGGKTRFSHNVVLGFREAVIEDILISHRDNVADFVPEEIAV